MAGLFSLGVASVFASLPPRGGGPGFPWLAVAVYGLLANTSYTLGAVTDLYVRRRLGDRAPAVAPVLFRYGFVFSIGLTLLPIPVAALGWLTRLVF